MIGKRGPATLQKKQKKKWQEEFSSSEDAADIDLEDIKGGDFEDLEEDQEYRKRRKLEEDRQLLCKLLERSCLILQK